MKKTKLLLLIGVLSFVFIQSTFSTDFRNVEFGTMNRTKYFTGISFVPGSGTSVVAVAQLSCIWYSADNGANWRQVNGQVHPNPVAEADIPTNDSTFNAVRFVNSQIGFACGGKKNIVSILFYTTDGGLTWRDISSQLPEDVKTKGFVGLSVFDESNVYFYGYTGVVVLATKSGSDWTFTKKMQVGNGTGDIYGLSFAGTNSYAALLGAKIYKNPNISDITVAWSQVSGLPATFYNTDVKFFDSSNGVAVANGSIVKSTDGGATWTPSAFNPTDLTLPTRFNKIAYQDAQKVFVCGAGGGILESVDGGSTWTKAISNSTRAINSIDIKNGQVLAVGLHGTIFSYPEQVPSALKSVDMASVTVFPNPVIDKLSIQTNENIKSIEVLGLAGESLFRTSEVMNSVFVGNLAKGIYFVRVKTDKGGFSQKFIKQ
jgi:photosystem II stability/assembly factor-like uncharacterized protein